jgi:hypothetical protein
VRILCLCLLSALVGLAQDLWYSVPAVSRGRNDAYLVGAAVNAIAVRGTKESKARVIVSFAPRWGTIKIGVRIEGLSEIIPEEDLWPYTGPDLGREALNPRMMQIAVFSTQGEAHFNSRMIMSAGGNFPTGVADKTELLFSTNTAMDKRFKAFLKRMSAGFDHGVVRIGQGVFSPPIEVKFRGESSGVKLKPLIESAEAFKAAGSSANHQRGK